MHDWTLTAAGFVGGILPDILRLLNNRYDGPPAYLRSWFFWLCFVVLGLLGAGLVYWLGAANIETALSIGFTGPEILRRLLSAGAGATQNGDGTNKARAVGAPDAWQRQRQWWSR
jgi:hypothetical protein